MNSNSSSCCKLKDLIDVEHFQNLQDRLNEIYSFPSSIIDIEGNILTATAWQDICLNFHRKHPECRKACIESDRHIKKEHLKNADLAVTYQCPHGLIDNAVPIIIDGIHYGSFFFGQCFMEEPDIDFFKAQAKKYGFPEREYLEALKKVPIWTVEQLNGYLFYIKGLTAIISESGSKNLRAAENKKQIQENERWYQSIIKTAIDGFLRIDKYGNLIDVNDSYCRMSGYSREELLKMNAGDLEAAEINEEVDQEIQEIIQNQTRRFIRRHRKKDGSLFVVEISSQYQPEDEGFVCFLRDITESKRLEESLSKSMERLDLASTAAKLGIWDWDIKNNILVWDESMYSLYGMTKNDTPLTFEDWQKTVFPGDRKKAAEKVNNAIQNKDIYNSEYRIIRSDNTIRYIRAMGKITRNSHGDPIRITGLNFDITENKELEYRLQQAQKMESIGTLAGGIAHDFNNILSPIMMYAELAMMELDPNNPLRNDMAEIFNAGSRARDLVNQILTFARKSNEKKVPIRLSMIITESIKFLRSTLPATINICYIPQTEEDTVLADASKLNQIVMNLCTNAAHAMKDKGDLLEISLNNMEITRSQSPGIVSLQPGRYVRLSVKDNGTGIRPEIMERIFEPYFTTKKVGEGTGLGLATVHGIVMNYSGDITVESTPGKGTIFHVYLPLKEKVTLEFPEMKKEIPRGHESILLVDDEAAVLKITGSLLKKFGYRVTSVESSTEAFDLFQKHPEDFDLVITDMTMPVMTGEVLAKKILSARPDIPVILCTGYSDNIDEDQAKMIGISEFVYKPIIMSDFTKTIRNILDRT